MESIRSCFPIAVGLPCIHARSAPALSVSGLLSVHLRYDLYARQVALATLYAEGFSSFVTSTATSFATGRSEPVPGRDFHPLWTSTFSRRTEIA